MMSKPAEWVEYTGSDEQIAMLLTSSDKFIVDSKWSVFKDPTKLMLLPLEDNVTWLKNLLEEDNVKKFMFCNPHPLADMICQQARTGQPVWWRNINNHRVFGKCDRLFKPFDNPSALEYSFTAFKELAE